MNNIFTFPNNQTTYYIDPAYIGNGSDGFSKRVDDLVKGNYLGWNGTGRSPYENQYTWQVLTPYLSKYYKYYLDKGDTTQSTMWNFWLQPLTEAHSFTQVTAYSEVGTATIEVKMDLWRDKSYQQVVFDNPHSFIHGENVLMENFSGYASPNNGQTARVSVVNDTTIILYEDQQLTQYKVTGVNDFNKQRPRCRRRGDGNIISWDTNHNLVEEGGRRLRLSDNFDTPWDTGTLNSTTTDFYYEVVSPTSIRLYTDANKTIMATLTERYVYGGNNGLDRDSLVLTFENTSAAPQTFSLSDVYIPNKRADGLSYATALTPYLDSYCRVGVINVTGTFTPNVLCSKPIVDNGGDIDFTSEFRFTYNVSDKKFTVYDSYPGGVVSDFTLSAGGSCQITVDFIDYASNQALGLSVYKYLTHSLLGDFTRTDVTYDGGLPYYTITEAQTHAYGNAVYTNLDITGATQKAVRVGNRYWLGNNTMTYNAADELSPVLDFTFDGAGRITSQASIRSGGRYRSNQARILDLTTWPNDYVPPVVNPEDVWDTADEWATTGYDAAKEWPTHVKPQTAKITVSQPSSQSYSQNGTKYVKTSGVVRYQVELEYPPMLYDDFKPFSQVVQAAQGQYNPFKLSLTGVNGLHIIFSSSNDNNPFGPIRFAEAYPSGTTVLKLEGLPANTLIFEAGDHCYASDGAEGNGNLIMVINETTSNAFGEAVVRLSYPTSNAIYPWYQLYKSPSVAIVTLNDDNFEYSVDAYGHYKFKVIFSMDQYK